MSQRKKTGFWTCFVFVVINPIQGCGAGAHIILDGWSQNQKVLDGRAGNWKLGSGSTALVCGASTRCTNYTMVFTLQTKSFWSQSQKHLRVWAGAKTFWCTGLETEPETWVQAESSSRGLPSSWPYVAIYPDTCNSIRTWLLYMIIFTIHQDFSNKALGPPWEPPAEAFTRYHGHDIA